jgi:hypothetical protein
MKYSVAILFVFVCFFTASKAIAQQDRFAKIGGQEYSMRGDQLIEPKPLVLPKKVLPIGIASNSQFKFSKKVDSKEALNKELDSIRSYYEPFMKNYAEISKTERIKLPITNMSWRVETEADQRDFANTLLGKGNWESVGIPHYGPPLGHAVTYYYKEMDLNEKMLSKGSLFLSFKGVDYKAEVFFNGVFCGMHEGFFAPFEFDVIKYAKKGKNSILVKVMNEPTTTGSTDDKGNFAVGNKIYAAGGLGYDEPIEGWHICPPAMGIYQDCYLEARSTLFVNDIFVRSLPDQSKAELWLEVYNSKLISEDISIDLSLFGRNFKDTVFMNKSFKATTTQVPGIGDMVKPTDWVEKSLPMQYGVNYIRIPFEIKNFRTWKQEQPWLYSLHVQLKNNADNIVDVESKHFGMRSFTMDTVNIPKGKMYLNNNFIRLRGANSMGFEQNDVKNKNWNQLRDDILLAKLCNMNFIRFTQRPVQSEVYDYCDMLGMLNQTDLPLFGAIRINQFKEVVKQAEEMERLVRSHPSTVVVTYINERFPNAEGSPQRSFSSPSDIFKIFSALDQSVLLSNPDRVIKSGDGDYDPPGPGLPDSHCYNTWYNGHAMDLGKFHKGYWQLIKPDWLYGCGEYGAEGLDPLNTMKKYYPASWLPKDATDDLSWTANRISKSQTNTFHYMWYPTQKGVESWIDASQNFQSWAVQFVTEAFRRDSRNVSSAVHLFIDAWPAGWMKAIMDVDRQPKKAFFSYRDALTPLMVSLRTDRYAWYSNENAEIETWICNDKNDAPSGSKIMYEVIVDGKVILKQEADASISINSANYQGQLQFKVPVLKKRSIAFVKVGLFDAAGKCIHYATQQLEIFPAAEQVKKSIFVYGESDNLSRDLQKESKANIANSLIDAKVVIIDNMQHYVNNKSALDAFVKNGGNLLFSEIAPGEYLIGEKNISVKHTIMGEYYFANLTDRLLKDTRFKDKDFFLWYDKKVGYIQPLLKNVFRAEGWNPIITTGLCNFAGEDPAGYLAAADLSYGKGKFIVCEITLANRIMENPAAYSLFKQLINE